MFRQRWGEKEKHASGRRFAEVEGRKEREQVCE